jgi:ATP adenylyltransferase
MQKKDESSQSRSPEHNVNIWAPWRIEYIESLGKDSGCFLCEIRDTPSRDEQDLVIWRGRRAITVMNRFPYTGGHCLIAPLDHVADLDQIDGETVLEMMAMVRDIQKAIAEAIAAQGFNVGINVGRCAGAGLPGHLHVHVVPRWAGDTNFMAVFGDVRVIPDALSNLRAKILAAAGKLGLPKL